MKMVSDNISLEQLCRSEVAKEQGIDNTPDDTEITENLKAVAQNILEPVFKHFGGMPDITSGYRCNKLNRLLGSSDSSQHCIGEAVDFGIIDTDIFEIATWISHNLDFDHLILEKYNPDNLNKGWVHVSYRRNGQNRRWMQTFDGKEYVEGLKKLPLNS